MEPDHAVDTTLLSADAPDAIDRAVRTLTAGEVVALPTETVYGLAADAANTSAVGAIFEAKDRPFFDPLIVHVPDSGWIERLAVVPTGQRALLERLTSACWPGPLTVLLPRRPEAVPDLVTAGSPLVALRISAHPVFRAVIDAFGRPLAAPSANRFGRISPTTGVHALSELRGRIPLVLDAGPTTHGLESTIVVLAGPSLVRILRHGPITAENLEKFAQVIAQSAEGTPAARSAPGQVAGHYAPRTPLVWLSETTKATAPGAGKSGLLAFRSDRPPLDVSRFQVEFLCANGDLREAAANLFAALRRLDEAGLDHIIAEPVPLEGLGRAIMERLRRAAVGSGIHDSEADVPIP